MNELFTDTKMELEETSKELESTQEKLEVTTGTLKVTERRLDRTTQDRDEQRHLVTVHVKTETKLHSEASQVSPTTMICPS